MRTKLTIGISGLEGSEKYYIQFLESLTYIQFCIGGTFGENLNKRFTHLIRIGNDDSTKTTKAREWKIPIVSVWWIFECAKLGEIIDVKGYGWDVAGML
ncbi:hypothetical protein BC938DRAFT_482700 [Jimgerdemannia flammicorona]|uniref:BRCT domain-containing protein n=1 Tax=Jimgerdemannia flammicorona TaxID=994334 RepID=A0A433QDE7_9FUNG|nr:hypothetical protein BC938DRAFT_482700 [Jimgerdemannia flammicorona]